MKRMSGADSSYDRLMSAWLPGRAPPISDALPARASRGPLRWTEMAPAALHEQPACINAASVPWVLVARFDRRPPATFECGLLASLACQDRVFQIDPVTVCSLEEIGRLCQLHAPRVLLIDLALLQDAGQHAVQHLRRRLPATDWLIGLDVPPTELDMQLLGPARGCVEWSLGSDLLSHALDAVTAGHLWFPRAVIEALYFALLGTATSAAIPGACVAQSGDVLTGREAEALTLMRQGMTNKQIAERLDISVNTVKKHLAHVFEKRGLHGRRQLVE